MINDRFNNKDLVTHGCEQVLRFTRVGSWNDLIEERKVQLAFNFGVVSLGLGLNKVDGYDKLSSLVSGQTSMSDFHNNMKDLFVSLGVKMLEDNIQKPF